MNADSTGGSTSHLKAGARPSLYTSDKPRSNLDKNVSILASLEPDRSAGIFSRAMRLTILFAILLVALSYWGFHKQKGENSLALPRWMESVLHTLKAPQPAMLAAPQPATVTPAAAPESLADQSHAAVITTDSTPAYPDTAAPQLSIVKELNKVDALPPAKPGATQAEVIVAAEPKIDNQKIASSDNPTVYPATKPAVSKPATTPATKAATNAATKPAPSVTAKRARDADVDLIAALLTRVPNTDAPGKDASTKATRTSAKAKADQAQVKRENRSGGNRDIVVRGQAESTDALIMRCRALGFFEGELCRIRICSQRWGIDPACPGPTASTQADN